ncbi:MAG: prolyl oligopeptidase family serine peptidase, partial [Halodesulfurarchaeum sp.]
EKEMDEKEMDEKERDGNGEGDEEPKAQVWVFDMERGGDARQVTDRTEGVREFDWGPHGNRLVIAARDPTEEQEEMLEERREGGPIEIERLQHKADGVGWLDEVKTYLFVVDLETGAQQRLDETHGAGILEPLMGLQPAWGERGIAYVTNRTERPDDSMVADVFVIDPDEDDPEPERVTDGDIYAESLEWGPEGRQLAFVGGEPTNWYKPNEVYVADLTDGSVSSRSGSLDRTVAWNGVPRWLDADELLCVFADEGWDRIVRLSTEEGAQRTFEWLPRDRTIGFFDMAGGTLALTISDPEGGHDVYTLSADDIEAGPGDEDPLTRLSALNEELVSQHLLPTVERVEYTNGDGDTIEAIGYLPPERDADERVPLVVSIHGGPMSYDAPEFRFDLAYLVGQGYGVLKPNYRGSTSYGGDFAERLRGTRGTLETDDVLSGVEHLVEAGVADPDRLFITGFSYGGITTVHVLTRDDRFAAGVAEHGIYDFYANFGTDDNHRWHEDEFGVPWENPDTYRDISSLTEVDQIDTPLCITAGENDWRCPPTQAEQLYVSLRKLGVDAKLVVYQDEHHAITEPERAKHRLETIADWFAEHDPESEG